jgi:phosphatidylinositol glycan class T
VSLRWPGEPAFAYSAVIEPPLAPLSVDRVLTTADQTRGTLHVSVSNPGPAPLDVLYAETLPALLTPYLHTLAVSLNGAPAPHAFELLRYTPTHGAAPTLLEARLHIPAGARLRLALAVGKRFLRYAEHPPDAQRGWDLPGAILTPLPPPANASGGIMPALGVELTPRTHMHTRTLLLDLATPDFSMPYNVIIMTCTLVALMFGSVFNMLTRKFVVVDLTRAGEAQTEQAVEVDAGKDIGAVG